MCGTDSIWYVAGEKKVLEWGLGSDWARAD